MYSTLRARCMYFYRDRQKNVGYYRYAEEAIHHFLSCRVPYGVVICLHGLCILIVTCIWSVAHIGPKLLSIIWPDLYKI